MAFIVTVEKVIGPTSDESVARGIIDALATDMQVDGYEIVPFRDDDDVATIALKQGHALTILHLMQE